MTAFNPDWVSAPGDSISLLMKRKDITVDKLSSLTGYSINKITTILSGEGYVTKSFAECISKELGGTSEFWLKRERQYRENKKSLVSDFKEWVSRFPYSDLAKFGWLAKTNDVLHRYHNLLEYYLSDSIEDWERKYGNLLSETTYRVSNSFDSDSFSVLSWLHKATLELEILDLENWNEKLLKNSLGEIRSLTRIKDPEDFIPKLITILNKAGVSMSIIPSPKGCSLNGATFKSDSGNPVIILSSRYLSDDTFWFTLFHEIGHVLLHQDKSLILEGGKVEEEIENEADDFSQKTLIPCEYLDELSTLTVHEWKKIPRFAKKIGVSSGIILGQLQHQGIIPRSHLNKLKTRYKWNAENYLVLKG